MRPFPFRSKGHSLEKILSISDDTLEFVIRRLEPIGGIVRPLESNCCIVVELGKNDYSGKNIEITHEA